MPVWHYSYCAVVYLVGYFELDSVRFDSFQSICKQNIKKIRRSSEHDLVIFGMCSVAVTNFEKENIWINQ